MNCKCFNTIPVTNYIHNVSNQIKVKFKKVRICKLCSTPMFTSDQLDEINKLSKQSKKT